jgi:hypothetical protein
MVAMAVKDLVKGVHTMCPVKGSIVGDLDCVLVQLGHETGYCFDKGYVIQGLSGDDGKYYLFKSWGRNGRYCPTHG